MVPQGLHGGPGLRPSANHKTALKNPPVSGVQSTVVYAQERGNPINRDKIEWKLLTDLPVTSKAEAIEKINWYATRWKIEVFHKILKSGCKAESSKLRTASRIANLISVFCIIPVFV